MKYLEKFNNAVGYVAALVTILHLFNVFYDAVARYFLSNILPFKVTSIGLQELEWHFFSIAFLFGIAYAVRKNAHVRVDLLYDKFTPRKRAVIDIFGTLFFLIPFALLLLIYGINFSFEAFSYGEQSGDPGGLKYRFVIKGMISLSMFFVLMSSIEILLKNFLVLKGKGIQKSVQS